MTTVQDLEALRRELLGYNRRYPYRLAKRPKSARAAEVWDAAREQGWELVTTEPPARDLYGEGGGWPIGAYTMLGEARLLQLQRAVETVVDASVPGDLIETGVWRGGACILMRAVLEALGDTARRVWVADSFRGVPPPDGTQFPTDAGDRLHEQPALAVTADEVRENFAAFGLLDERVQFLEGWFRNTLPALRGRSWAVIRLDGDLYESTMDGLENLYDGLSPGGFVIIDDWGAMPTCRRAVEDFRDARGITDPIHEIDWTGVYWRKGG